MLKLEIAFANSESALEFVTSIGIGLDRGEVLSTPTINIWELARVCVGLVRGASLRSDARPSYTYGP